MLSVGQSIEFDSFLPSKSQEKLDIRNGQDFHGSQWLATRCDTGSHGRTLQKTRRLASITLHAMALGREK
jgi:hypothetical protein